MQPTYDKYGRMRYHPDYHGRHLTPWTNHDEAYVIQHYYADGPHAVSLALERTILSVMEYACALRKQGKLAIPAKRCYTPRSPKPDKPPRNPPA